MNSWTFMIEQLTNGAWHVGWREGHDDYGRLMPARAGFSTYAEAEKFATTTLRDLLRKHRDELAKAAKNAAHAERLAAALAAKRLAGDNGQTK
jgi:hypothetical protein